MKTFPTVDEVPEVDALLSWDELATIEPGSPTRSALSLRLLRALLRKEPGPGRRFEVDSK